MHRSIAIALALFLGATGAAAAHDGHDHGAQKMVGTVTAVHPEKNHVQIQTSKGAAEFFVNADTKFVKGKEVLTLAALTPGTRVVVETKTVDNATVAGTVRVGAAGKAPAAPKAPGAHAGHGTSHH